MKISLILLLLCVLAAAVSAQPVYWEPTAGGFDRALIDKFFTTPSGTWFAFGDEAQYRSTDRGASWQRWTDEPPFSSPAVGPDGELYGMIGGRLRRSTNEGLTWTIHSGETGALLAFAGDTAWMLTSSRPSRSTDRGVTWQRVTLPGTDLALYSSLTVGKNGRVAIADGTYLLVTTNGGAVWNSRPPTFRPRDVWFDSYNNLYANADGILYRSSNDGVSWTRIDTMFFRSGAAAPDGTIFMNVKSHRTAAGELDGVIRSTDGGVTWRTVYRDRVGALDVAPTGEVIISTLYNILVSTDAGGSWSSRSSGLSGPPVGNLFAGPAGEVYVGASSTTLSTPPYDVSMWSLSLTTDEGGSWHRVADSLSGAIHIDAGGNVLGSTVYSVLVPGYNRAMSRLVRSSDRGATWTVTGPPISGTIRSFADDGRGTILAANEKEYTPKDLTSGLFRSTDGGRTWDSTAFRGTVSEIVASASGSLFASGLIDRGTAGTERGFFRSTDRGANWRMVLRDTSVSRIVASPDGTIYAYGSAARLDFYLRSDDDGITWKAILGEERSTMMMVSGTGDLYVGGRPDGAKVERLARTTDRGETWRTLRDSVVAYQVIVGREGTLYLATIDSLFRSTDNGATWGSFTGGLRGEGTHRIGMSSAGRLFATAKGVGVYRSTGSAGVARGGDAASAAGVTIRPNPFRDVTEITFRLDRRADVRIDIVDALGRVAARPHRGVLDAGEHLIPVEAGMLNGDESGVFFCRVDRGGSVTTVPIVILR